MPRVVDVYRAKVDPANVERLLEVRGPAIAAFQREVPELLRAQLVRLDDDTWLDILEWSEPVDQERQQAAAAASSEAMEMHELVTEPLGHDRGELVHAL